MTGVPRVDWVALAPVWLPAAALLLVLLLDAVLPRRGRWVPRVLDAVSVLGLLAAGAMVVRLAARKEVRGTICVPSGLAEPASCSYVASQLTLTLQAVLLAGALGCLLLALDGPTAADRTPHHVLLLSATVGAVALAGSRDLASLTIALETATLPAIALVALRRDARSAQAGVTFLLTALGSLGMLLLGVALLYVATGSLFLTRIAAALSAEQAGELPATVVAVAVLGVLFAVAGIGFKLSAVPFQLWTPDTYAGAPLPVSAFLAVVSKAAGLAGLAVLLAIGLPGLAGHWGPVLGGLAALTITVGNLVALQQRGAVRLLAWSAVAQAGWILLPLAAAGHGRDGVRAALSASAGYLLAYGLATLAAFTVVVLVSRHHPDGERHTLDAYTGLIRREPVAATVLGFALACLAGLPPGVMGLVAKVIAVRPVVDAQQWPLALIAAVNVVLALVYYLRWAGLLVQRPEGEPPTWRVTTAEGLVLGGAGAGCLLLSVFPQAVAGLLPALLR